MSPTGFAIEVDSHKPTLRFAVAEAVRFASIMLRFEDAEISVIRLGELTVVTPLTSLTLDDLDAVLHLAARKFGQVNDIPLASITRTLQDES